MATNKTTRTNVEDINTVTAQSLATHILINSKLKQVTYINGPAGVGKTEIVRAAAEAMGYVMKDFSTSDRMADDFGGIPTADTVKKRAVLLMPYVVADMVDAHEATGKPVFAFFDEINNGALSVMAACFKLLHEGHAAGFKVPEGTVFCAAGNPPEVSSVAQELPAPLLNRFSVLNYNGPTLEEWETHALGRMVHPAVLGFIKQQPQFLIDKSDFNSGKPTPTPRSWMAASAFLHEYDALVGNMGSAGNEGAMGGRINRVFRMEGLAARVGSEGARMMEAALKYSDSLVSWSEIQQDPETAKAPQEFAPAYMQAVALVAAVGHKSVKDTKIAMTYAKRLPSEVRGVLAIGLSNRVDGPYLRSAFTADDYKATSALASKASALVLKRPAAA